MAKSKSKSKSKKEATGVPQIIPAKGGLTASQLLKEALLLMEEGTRISKAAGKDFMDSLEAAIAEALSNGQPVKLGNLVKFTPRLHTKGQREVHEEFGNSESPMVTKKYPAKTSLKVTALKGAKDALPSVQKMQKALGK